MCFQVTTMSSRYKVMPSGALHITNANEDDPGEYTCRGENALGSVEQTTTIKLLSKSLFKLKPVENIKYQNIKVSSNRIILYFEIQNRFKMIW